MILLRRAEQVALNFHLFLQFFLKRATLHPSSTEKKYEHDLVTHNSLKVFVISILKILALWHAEYIFCHSGKYCFLQTRRPVFIRPQKGEVYSISQGNKKFY